MLYQSSLELVYNIPFVFDYMRSMGVAGAYPKMGSTGFLVFDMILHLCCSLSLILQLRIEASKHVISVNDYIPSDFHVCTCNVDQALFPSSPRLSL